MSEDDPGPCLELEWKHRLELSLSKCPDVRLAKVGIPNYLCRNRVNSRANLLCRKLKRGRIPVVKFPAISPDRIHTVALQLQQHRRNRGCCLGVILKQPLLAFFQNLHSCWLRRLSNLVFGNEILRDLTAHPRGFRSEYRSV